MPNTSYDMYGIYNYWVSHSGGYMGTAVGWRDMNSYLGTRYYTASPSGGNVHTFPTSSLGLQSFYGTSPYDEWYVPPSK